MTVSSAALGRPARTSRHADGDRPACQFGYEGLVWSPDGTSIAYACGAHSVLVEADGGKSRLIDFGMRSPISSPSSWPDGKWLAFMWLPRATPASSHGIGDHDADQPLDLDCRRDGSRRRLVAHNAIGYPAWSPSGARIAYQSRCGTVRLVTPAGAEVTPAAHTFTCHGGVRGKPSSSPMELRSRSAASAAFSSAKPMALAC